MRLTEEYMEALIKSANEEAYDFDAEITIEGHSPSLDEFQIVYHDKDINDTITGFVSYAGRIKNRDILEIEIGKQNRLVEATGIGIFGCFYL